MVTDANNLQKIKRLVRCYTSSSSTADLLVYIAADKELLSLSRTLIVQIDQNLQTRLTENVSQVCAKDGILITVFCEEIKRVLQALNLKNSPQAKEYEILGIDPGVSWEEVKKAYRGLSIMYHPDRAGAGRETKEKFVEISEAYHALEKIYKVDPPHQSTKWRKEGRRPKKVRKVRFVVTIIIVVFALLLFSIFYTWLYRQKVYVQQVREFARFSGALGDKQLSTLS